MEKIDRVQTGLGGLDKILQGGLPRGSITLLSGACGTGKTTFAMQFVYDGAKYWKEPGVYITLEEDPKKLMQNMSLFWPDIQKLVEQKKILIIKPEVYKFESIKQMIRDAIDRIDAKRLVVDSYSVLLTYFSDPGEIRNGLVQLDREIKKMNCTAIVISDIKDNSEIFSTTGVEEFIVDGVIVLYMIRSPHHPFQFERAVSVRKMRATHHTLNMYTFHITDKGVQIPGDHVSAPHEIGERRPRRARHARVRARARRKKAARPRRLVLSGKKPRSRSSMIEVSSLARKGGHSWRWKHL